MLTFEYYFILENGYKPVLSTEPVNDINIVIKAPNRATADRMVKAFINDNVIEHDGVCIDDNGVGWE